MTLEASVPAVVTPPPPSEEERMAAALENAGIAGEFEEFRYRGQRGGDEQHHGRGVHVTHNHFNLIPAEAGEIGPQDDGEEESLPPLAEEDESSDDETYVDEELEDVELIYDESEDEQNSSHSQEDRIQETRSGRQVRPPARYRGTTHISVGGMHFTVSQMHFLVAATDLTTPIPVMQDEIKILAVIMTQLSLKEGLRRFGTRGKEGSRRREIRHYPRSYS